MARLILSFLGGFQVELDGQPLTWFKSNKVRALLAYLALETARPHRRDTLAAMFWPEQPARNALSNLRFTLASLRRTLGEPGVATPFLQVERDTIRLNPGDVYLDAADLERQIAFALRPPTAPVDVRTSGALSPDGARHALQAALALYQGPLLDGFSAGDAGPFEEWVVLRREHIAQQVMVALGWLAADAERRGAYSDGQFYSRRRVAFEPWNEDAHRALMRALALDGQRTAALHQYQACCRVLIEEFGAAPSDETVVLEAAIRAGTLTRATPHGQQEHLAHDSPLSAVSNVAVQRSSSVVARDEQLAELDRFLAGAVAGSGSVAFVTGEAGCGKTVLLGEFTRRALSAYPDLLVATGTCDAASGIGDPYQPFRELLQLLTGDIEARRAGATLAPEHARRLWAAIPDAVEALVEQGPGLIDTLVPGATLALRAEAFSGQSQHTAWQTRLRRVLRSHAASANQASQRLEQGDFIEQVTHVLQTLARRHALLLVLDDLQWADAGTISLFFHLSRRIATSRILIVGAYRPDAIVSPDGVARHSLELVVNELRRVSGEGPVDLDACDGRHFVAALLAAEGNTLDATFADMLVRQTEGHPLFTVELLRSLEERGELVRDAEGRWAEGQMLHWNKVPVRVDAVIAERINRLPDRYRMLLAAASVEGQEFTAEEIAAALGMDAQTVIHCLSSELGERQRLVAAVSVRRQGAGKLSRYRFRHHLFQQVLYEQLDPVQRAHLHEAVGSAIEQLNAEPTIEADSLAPRLARHFEEAGLAERAAAYHLRAGRRAAHLAVPEEAVEHLMRGIALLDALPDTPERKRLKLELYLSVTAPLSYVRGFWSAERANALERAYEIAQQPAFSDSDAHWMVSAAVAYFAMWSADTERSLQISRNLLADAQRCEDVQKLHWAHSLTGLALLMRGDLPGARMHLDNAIDAGAGAETSPHEHIVGIHLPSMSLAWQSFTLWQLGYPDRAMRLLQEARATAERRNHPITLAFVHSVASMILFVCARDTTMAGRHVQELRLSTGISLVFGAWADSLAGVNRMAPGRNEELLDVMRQGIAAFERLGSGLGRASQFVLLAQSYGQLGQVQEGLSAIQYALRWMEQTGVHALLADAHRMHGELLLMDPDRGQDAVQAAEACFLQAIEVARQQQARWWELCATVSLCRLRMEGGDARRRDLCEARQRLADLYAWFDEGFDTQDLRAARELLQMLDGCGAPATSS